jgi:predicted nucleotidyltransferase
MTEDAKRGLALLPESERLALLEAARELRARFPVDSLSLFGSKARGDSDAESDIDLLVLTSRPLTRDEKHRLIDVLFDVGLARDVVFSPLVVPAADWWEGIYQALPIRREVDEQGIAL